MRRRQPAILLFGISLVLGGISPSLAHAAKPVPPPNAARSSGVSTTLAAQTPAFWAKQRTLGTFKAWLISVPGIKAAGYVESVDDVPTTSTTLLWHGASPLQRAAIRQGRALGVTVKVRPWAYSSAQIDAGIAALWKQIRTDAAWRGFTVADIVGIDPAHPGLVVEGSWTGAPSLRGADATRLRALRTRAAAAAHVAVDVVTGVAARPAAATRSNDFAPYNAAGYMLSPSSSTVCSTGFSVNYRGATHTTTARHCNHEDYRARDGSNTYGTSVTTSFDGQARVLSRSGSPLNFDGAWNNAEGFVKRTVGLVDLSINNFVCTSGGNSGVHCNIKITALSVSFNDGFGAASTIRGVQQSAGAISAIQGDSGGTVFTLSGPNVLAAGMIQAIDGTLMSGAGCGSVHDGGGNLCSRQVLFTSTRTIVNALGASLVT